MRGKALLKAAPPWDRPADKEPAVQQRMRLSMKLDTAPGQLQVIQSDILKREEDAREELG